MISRGITTLLAAAIFVWAADEPQRWSFEEDKPGELPKGWLEAKSGEGEGSVWRVVEYQADGKTRHALAQTSSKGADAFFNLCVRTDIKQADVDLSVSLKAVRGELDQGGGLVWRYRDAKNYYITRWNPLEDNFRVYHVVAGKRSQLASVKQQLPTDAWHTIRTTMVGDHIRCYLDGKLHLDVRDETIPEAGAVGLWSKADAVSWFDDLTLARPAAE